MQLSSAIAAIVTGGASGLGEGTARMLAAQGVKVGILDVNAERGAALAKELGGAFARCDVTDEASLDAALASLRRANGVERIAVSCAGIGPAKRVVSKKRETGEFIGHDLASFAKVVQVNLIGTFHVMTKAAVAMAGLEPVTPDGGRGVIINTASVAATDGQVGQIAYSASKGGVLAMTLPAARDLASWGIRVCTIMPGLFDTPMFDTVPPDFRKTLEAGVPFPSRLGKPSEYAALARAIIENDMLNGEAIRLDGALRMAPR